jgi:pre-mRNA-processing factor 6
MIQGQIQTVQGNLQAARISYSTGVKACPKDVTLWILASRLEELDGKSIKARSLLEKGRLVNPANERLWAEAVGVEERSGSSAQAKTVLSRGLSWSLGMFTGAPIFLYTGLQDCPSSGTLWSLAIWAEPRATRKARSVDALKKSKDDPIIICTVARLFWAESKIEKAREWFVRAVKIPSGKKIGDSWAWWLKFEEQHGTPVRKFEDRLCQWLS